MHVTALDDWMTSLVLKSKHDRICYAYRNLGKNFRAVVFNPDDDFYREAMPEEKEMSRADSFYHELGHLLCKHGFDIDKDNALGESCADAYAALRLLQRYGDDARGLIARTSWRRAAKFLENNAGEYLTTPVTVRILADAADGQLAALSPAQTVAAAEDYARRYRPDRHQIEDIRRVFAQDRYTFFPDQARTCQKLEHLAHTCLNHADTFSFRIGALVLNPFLHEDGGDFGTQRVRLNGTVRENLSRAIEGRGLAPLCASLQKDLMRQPSAGTAKRPLVVTF